MSSILGKAQDLVTKTFFGTEKRVLTDMFYNLIDRDMNGDDVKMSKFEGKVLLAVNVASKWGLTKQNYTELVKLREDYGERGLEVLAFPCNQFGRQEPGNHEEILTFTEKFNARDKLVFFEKADVNGADAREVFGFLKQKLPNTDESTDIRWNFAKFLVDHEGNPYMRFGPKTSPFEMKDSIEILLDKKESAKGGTK